jgi:nucleotide-binding universal stress UspA family protein
MPLFRRIMHPSDFSAASARAFAYAVKMAKDGGAELLLVHVLTPVMAIPPEGYISPKLYEGLEASSRAQARKQLDALVTKAGKAGARATALLVDGAPADRIAATARSRRADVIVMGTHGRGGLAKFFLGSVAARVVATAACPVMTVKGG